MKKQKIEKWQFSCKPDGYGVYACKYETPIRGDYYKAKVFDLELIEAVKNNDYPTQAAMKRLRATIIATGTHFSNSGYMLEF